MISINQKTNYFGYADGLLRLIDNHRSPNEDVVIAAVAVKKEVQHILLESIQNTPVTMIEVQKAITQDGILQKTMEFVKTKWPSVGESSR